MDSSALELKLEEERLCPGLTHIDFHYLEISSLLISSAKDDIRQKQLIRQLVEDLFTLRISKLRTKLKALEATSRLIDLTHVAAMEMQIFRGMIGSVFEGLATARGRS